MIEGKVECHDEVLQAVFETAYANLVQVAKFWVEKAKDLVGISNAGEDMKYKLHGACITEPVYLNPSKAGEAPRAISGSGRDQITFEEDKDNMALYGGVNENGKHMLALQTGVEGGKIIQPSGSNALRFFSKAADAFLWRHSVEQGQIKPRPWMDVAIEKNLAALEMIAAEGTEHVA